MNYEDLNVSKHINDLGGNMSLSTKQLADWLEETAIDLPFDVSDVMGDPSELYIQCAERLRELGKLEPLIKSIVKYCEDQEIYDKLGNYNDFYYKLKGHVK